MANSIQRFWNIIKGVETESTYAEATNALLRVENVIQQIKADFPNVTSFDFKTVKNKWTDLPAEVSQGVSTMGLHLSEEYRSILTYYSANSYIAPHTHSNEWEVIKVLEGSAYDTISKVTLNKGDIYIIPKGVAHHVTSENECYMYILFTSHKEFLKIPHTEPDIAKRFIEKYKFTKAKKLHV